MLLRQFLFLFLFAITSVSVATANDTLRFSATNLPCNDHYTYLNNDDSSSGNYDTLYSRSDNQIVFDSIGHFVDTTFYTINAIPQAQLHIVYGKIAGFISYIHFTSGPIILSKSVTFELRNVMTDLSLSPTHLRLHGDTLNGHDLSFFAQYKFVTGGGYSENAYTSTGQFRDSSLFTFSLTPEIPTAGVAVTDANSALQIFPNPASKLLHLRAVAGSDEHVAIYDLLGSKILSSTIQGPETEIGVSDIPNGMYILRAGKLSRALILGH
ncbi:MAG: T9SS type A sorting domain-containing protein [Ignavibacteriota bacterium]